MNTAIGIQNDATQSNEEQQPPPTDNSTTTSNNEEDDMREQQERDGSIEIISDPLTGSINVFPESTTDMNSMADTNKLEEGMTNAQGTQANINNGNESDNNGEGVEDETDNQCQLWSSTQPSTSAEPPSNSNPTSTSQTTSENNTFGDIWSTEAFSYYTTYQSPLKILLDSNSYTLCELLKQDELLQELRGCEIKLIDYFSKEEVVAELAQVLMVDVPHEQDKGEGEDGKERWIKQEEERRAKLKLQKEKQDKEQEKRSYAQAVESPENKLPSSQEGLTFDASSPDNQPPNATLDINTPNGSSPTFLPSPNDEEELGNEELEKDEEELLTPLGMLFIFSFCVHVLTYILHIEIGN